MIPSSFQNTIQIIRNLEKNSQYIGAFIYGSGARDTITNSSDFDVKVIVERDKMCSFTNHPIINGVKLDIAFISQEQLEQKTVNYHEINRVPMIAESFIVFDKNGSLSKLKQRALNYGPLYLSSGDYLSRKFTIDYLNDEVLKYIEKDQYTALLAMHVNLGELLQIFYNVNGKWFVSNKRILSDLDTKNKKLSSLLRTFLEECNVHKKFRIWQVMIDYILEPMGGRLNDKDRICHCKICKQDLINLIRNKKNYE